MDKNQQAEVKRVVRIVFLWAEVIGYVRGVLEELSKQTSGTIDVVHWDQRNVNSTQYKFGASASIRFHARSQMDGSCILDLLKTRNPQIIVISGWMDKDYIRACRKYKKLNPNVKVVAGIDDQWVGSIRQRLGQLYFRIFYRPLFDYMWISGEPQFSFVQRYGYGIENIISNLYSADTRTFNQRASIGKRFVYVGRFVKIKALDQLVDAYCRLSPDKQTAWPLVLIGDGDQKAILQYRNNPNIQILPFMQPNALMNELRKGGVGCVTSHMEPWGVVVHEHALMGLPLLLSSACGAATEFMIPGYNGFMFKKGDVNSLYHALERFCNLSDIEFKAFSERSLLLGQRINNEISAASLLSVTYL